MRSLVAITALVAAALVLSPRPAAAGGVHVSIGIPLPLPVVTALPVVPYYGPAYAPVAPYYGPVYAPVVPYGYYAPYGGHRHHAHCGHGYDHRRPREPYRGAGYGHYDRYPGVRGYTLR